MPQYPNIKPSNCPSTCENSTSSLQSESSNYDSSLNSIKFSQVHVFKMWNHEKKKNAKRNFDFCVGSHSENPLNEMKWNEMKRDEMRWDETRRDEMKWNEMKWNEMK